MRIFKRIWTLGSNDLYNEAMRFFNEHNYREAIAKFEELLGQKRSLKSLHYNLSLVYASQSHRNLGIVLFATGSYREALEEFKMALHFNPDYNELNYFIGVCQNNLGDFKGAIDSFNTVLSVDPHNLPVALRFGVVLHNNKMWDRAASLYKEILFKNPQYADIHYNLGLAFLGQGQVARALASFESALEINHNYLQARIKIVVAHIYLGKLDEALVALTALISSFPDYADLHYYLGLLQTSRKEWENARGSFMRALAINPSYKEAKIKLAAVYCYLDQFEQGLKELEELHAVDPGDGDVATMLQAIRGVLASSRGENFAGVLRKMLKDSEITKNIPEFNKSIRINPDCIRDGFGHPQHRGRGCVTGRDADPSRQEPHSGAPGLSRCPQQPGHALHEGEPARRGGGLLCGSREAQRPVLESEAQPFLCPEDAGKARAGCRARGLPRGLRCFLSRFPVRSGGSLPRRLAIRRGQEHVRQGHRAEPVLCQGALHPGQVSRGGGR